MKPFSGRATCLLAVLWPLALPGSASGSDLASRAKEVLRRYCLECHGGASPRGGLRVLDHALLVKERKVVLPASPGSSELLDLVMGGSMPPGTRPRVPAEDRAVLRDWVQAGAALFPPDSGEEYVLRKALEDAGRLPPEKRKHVRYLSLNHLLSDDQPQTELSEQRDNLTRALRYLVPAGARAPPAAVPIDPARTLFRIDLRELGWDRQPFKVWAQKGPYEASRLTLFDLVLLEYPYATLPTTSPLFADLASFLRTAGQVRPIPYVRADWLVSALTRPPLHADFLELLGKPADSKPPALAGRNFRTASIGLATAAAELGRRGDRAELEKAFAGPAFTRLGLAPLGHKGEVRRDLWERHFDQVAWRLGAGVPIVPLDALARPDHNALPFTLEVKTIAWSEGGAPAPRARDTFVPKDKMAIWVKANQDAVVELIYTSVEGKKVPLEYGQTKLLKAGRAEVCSREGKGYTIGADFSGKQITEQITVFAYPQADLEAAEADFPKGQILVADGVKDRTVHPLYTLLPGGKGIKPPAPGKMAKVTVSFTVRAAKRED